MLVPLVLAFESFCSGILASTIWARKLAWLVGEHVSLKLIWSIEDGLGRQADATLVSLNVLTNGRNRGRSLACDLLSYPVWARLRFWAMRGFVRAPFLEWCVFLSFVLRCET